jgi:hypothetical protein
LPERAAAVRFDARGISLAACIERLPIRDTKLQLRWPPSNDSTSSSHHSPRSVCPSTLYNPALAAAALHHTSRVSLNRNHGAAIMQRRFNSV